MKFSLYRDGRAVTDKILLSRLQNETIGVFETLKAYGGSVFRAAEHLKRFQESAKTAGCRLVLTPAKIEKDLTLALKRHAGGRRGDWLCRLTLWQDQLFVMIGDLGSRRAIYQKGVRLRTTVVRRSLSHAAPPEVKTAAYHNAVMASLEPKEKETYEWVFLDREGWITEVRIGNLFMVKAGALRTPPTLGILNGVTRRFVIECAFQSGIPVEESPLTRHDFFNADEAFLTNTSWEILPVAALDGRRIGTAVPGRTTRKLQTLFRKQVKSECP